MLTEAEKKWLEEREKRICKFCIHCPDYINTIPCLDCWADICVMDTTLEEFRDAAEFEARVVKEALHVTIGDLPCADGPDCKAPHFGKYNTEEKSVGCSMCGLCVARLAVEQEMDV